jgi:hypothetical protein
MTDVNTPNQTDVLTAAPDGTTRHTGRVQSVVATTNADGSTHMGLLVDIGEEQLVQAFPNDQSSLSSQIAKALNVAARVDVFVGEEDKTAARAYKITLV